MFLGMSVEKGAHVWVRWESTSTYLTYSDAFLKLYTHICHSLGDESQLSGLVYWTTELAGVATVWRHRLGCYNGQTETGNVIIPPQQYPCVIPSGLLSATAPQQRPLKSQYHHGSRCAVLNEQEVLSLLRPVCVFRLHARALSCSAYGTTVSTGWECCHTSAAMETM